MVPSLLFMVIEAFHRYVWQHDEQYVRVTFARALNPLTLMVFIVGLGPWLGVLSLPLGFLFGQLLSAGATCIGVPYKFRFNIGMTDPDVRNIFRNSFVLMGTGVFARSRSVIVQYFGSFLGEGAISAMAIAYRLCEPIFQKALVGIRMIVFSRSAKASAEEDMGEFARLYRISIIGVLLFVMPIATWYVLESDIIVRAVFQRGEFNDRMANLVIGALTGYAGMIVFAGLVQILSNGFYALNRIAVPAVMMPVGTGIFLVLAALLSPRLGVFGLTLSSSITSALLATGLTLLIHRHVTGLRAAELFIAVLKYFVLAIVAAALAMSLRQLLGFVGIGGVIFSGLVVAVLYLALLYLTRDKMLHFIVDKMGIRLFDARKSGSGSK
jgi:putative peptidoglycan lipid II flippase